MEKGPLPPALLITIKLFDLFIVERSLNRQDRVSSCRM